MALPLPPGLTPPEIAFLCEMELVTVIPRQRLEGLELLGGRLPPLNPPHRTPLPLWLALLLKRQRRANILPPPWLAPHSLTAILDHETNKEEGFSPPPRLPPLAASSTALAFSPPFLASSTAEAAPDALPYHWLEIGEMLLEAASDDFEEPDSVRKLLRGLREVRMAKLRKGVELLYADGGIQLNGVGAMEVSEGRAFVTGVIDNLRKIGASREQQRKDRDREDRENGYPSTADYDDDEMEMQ